MDKFSMDYKRYGNRKNPIRKYIGIFKDSTLRGIYLLRQAENKKNKFICRCLKKWGEKSLHRNGIECGLKNVGGGILFVHAYAITINNRAHIGENFTIFKGATIGSIRSGKKNGTPTIGDRVTVCSNAFVCGNIRIGNDVLIAANSFVNFDVPSNSVVIGNPGVIYHKENPSIDYLKNI